MVYENTKKVTVKSLVLLSAVVTAVILPQIFHLIGIMTGTGASLGKIFLPMHFPVILCGFIAGPLVGFLAGILSPVISFSLTSMPAFSSLPFMVIELGIYGLTAGIIKDFNINNIFKMLIVLISGRIARMIALLFSFYILGNTFANWFSVITAVKTGLIGIIIELIFIPLILTKVKNKGA